MHLRDLGHSVDCVHDGGKGYEAARSGPYDIVVLDVMLPVRDGLDVLRALRIDRVDTPVLMLTARSGEIDRVLGLELGADDYLTKPFSIPELQARVKAILRRIERQRAPAAAGAEADRIQAGELEIDCRQPRGASEGPAGAADRQGVRSAAALRAQSGARVHAHAAARLGLGHHLRGLRAQRQHPHQPAALQDRDRPGQSALRADRARRGLPLHRTCDEVAALSGRSRWSPASACSPPCCWPASCSRRCAATTSTSRTRRRCASSSGCSRTTPICGTPTARTPGVRGRLREFNLYSPNIGLYLLDDDGRVLASAGEGRQFWSIPGRPEAAAGSLAQQPRRAGVGRRSRRRGQALPRRGAPDPVGRPPGRLAVRGAAPRPIWPATTPELLRSYAVRTAVTVSLMTLTLGVLLTISMVARADAPADRPHAGGRAVHTSDFTEEVCSASVPNCDRDDEIGRLEPHLPRHLRAAAREMQRVSRPTPAPRDGGQRVARPAHAADRADRPARDDPHEVRGAQPRRTAGAVRARDAQRPAPEAADRLAGRAGAARQPRVRAAPRADRDRRARRRRRAALHRPRQRRRPVAGTRLPGRPAADARRRRADRARAGQPAGQRAARHAGRRQGRGARRARGRRRRPLEVTDTGPGVAGRGPAARVRALLPGRPPSRPARQLAVWGWRSCSAWPNCTAAASA